MTDEKPKGKPRGMAAVSPERRREIYAARSAKRAATPPAERVPQGFATWDDPGERKRMASIGGQASKRELAADEAREIGAKGREKAKRLQKAQPLMLAALKVLRVTAVEYGVPEDHQDIKMADGAIAKAEGD